jgi:hypothetical protein
MTTPPVTEPHGFVLLMTTDKGTTEQAQVYRALRAAGFAPWDGNGFPLFVALEGHAPKHQWFEAGFWAGARVPLFGFGVSASFRQRHHDVIARLGGWMVWTGSDAPAELLGAVARRGLSPSAWDRAQHAAWTAGPGAAVLSGEGRP